MRVVKSKHMCDWHESYFTLTVAIKYWKLGFVIEKWGLRICLIWWHLCF